MTQFWHPTGDLTVTVPHTKEDACDCHGTVSF